MAASSWRLLSAMPGRILAFQGVRQASGSSIVGGIRKFNQLGLVPMRFPGSQILCSNWGRAPCLAPSQGRNYATQSEVVEKVNEEIEKLSPDKIFAVVHISGRQFKITKNDLIVINRIAADVGEKILLEKVLLAGSENFSLIGTPLLSKEMVRVHATVTEHSKTAKVIIFKKKRRKNYKRKRGHRQDMTVLRINDIHLSSDIQ